MQIAAGTVVDGKVVVEGAALPEGAVVAVLSRGAEQAFGLSSAHENELLAAIADIERGDFVGLEELLASLPSSR